MIKKKGLFKALLLLVSLVFSFQASKVQAQPSPYTMIIQVLETAYNESAYAIQKIAEYELGNTVMLTQNSIEDEGWSLTDLDLLIGLCNSLSLYVILCPYNYTDWTGQATNTLYVSPTQYSSWKLAYPFLYGVCFPEVYGHQIEHSGYNDNSSGTIFNQMDAEEQIPGNMTTLYNVTGFRAEGAKIFMQDNSLSYITAQALNTSDVYMVKLFNSANNEVMIGQGRGMSKSFGVSSWGATIDLWGYNSTGDLVCPDPDLTWHEAAKALYESWFYGATVFHWEQGSFNGSWTDGDTPDCGNILVDEHGSLTDYGYAVQNFTRFLSTDYANDKAYTESKIAVMLGQGGYGGRGPDWGLGIMNETAHTQAQAWMQFGLFNYFYPNISDGSLVVDAWTYVASSLSKHFAGLPFGMVDIISVYASPETMSGYSFIFGLGWTCLNDDIVASIHSYVVDGGIFLAFATYLNSNATVPLGDLENPYSFYGNVWYFDTFGCTINTTSMVYDKFHTSVNFYQNTFFYDYYGTSYTFSSQWTWHFNMLTILSENVSVIASYDNYPYTNVSNYQIPNATIIQHHLGSGYVYIINAREDSLWMPNKVFGDVIGDFINRLCNYTTPALEERMYPDDDCLLHYNQTGEYILVIHDNTTTAYDLDILLDRPRFTSVHDFITSTDHDFITVSGTTLSIDLAQNDGYCLFLGQVTLGPIVDNISWLIMPVMGLFGFFLSGFGLFYVGNKIRQRDAFEAIRACVVALAFILIGAGLIIGWLW